MSKKITLHDVIEKNASEPIKNIYFFFNLALKNINKNPYLLSPDGSIRKNKKDPDSNVDYDIVSRVMYLQSRTKDREFPLDTVKIKIHEYENNERIDEATIHTGYSADEYARNMNVLAFTIGKDIYFRAGKYKPETEEGRVLLAHELKHVSQNTAPSSKANKSIEELEQEAMLAEQAEKYDTDPIVEFEFESKIYRLRESELRKIEEESEWLLEQKIIAQEQFLSEEQYLELLLRYEKYTEERELERYFRKLHPNSRNTK